MNKIENILNEEFFRSVLDNLLEGCQIIGFDWKYIYLNNTAEIHNRRPKEELLGKKFMDMWPGIEETEVFNRIATCLSGRLPDHIENEFVFPDGNVGWFDLSIQPINEGVLILSIDISQRKIAEEALLQSEITFRKIYEDGPFGMAMVSGDHKFIAANNTFCMMTGYSEEELKRITYEDITDPKDVDKDFTSIKKLIAGEISVYKTEKRYLKKDGQIIWGALTVSSNYSSNGQFLYNLAIIEDVTERKEAEIALRESRDLMTNLACLVPGVIYQYRLYPDGRSAFPFSSPGMYNIYEVTPEEVREDATPVFGMLHPDDYDHVVSCIQESARTMNTFYCEFRVKLPKQGVRWRWSQAHPTLLEDGSILWHGIISDITEKKQAEAAIKALNEELEQRVIQRTSQLEAANNELEAFSYSISHDLRAPLRGINGFTQILMEDYGTKLDDEGRRLCAIIQDNSRNMGLLIDDLLKFSRLSRAEMQLSVINMQLMANTIFYEITDENQRERIELNVGNICNAKGDPSMLRQVWVNLLSNAIKYSSKREQTKITVMCSRANDECIFSIKDNGVGFDMKYKDKLFGVFQRLHGANEFEGTGVGLAIVQRIVHRHGGRVWADAEVDKGATFSFSLPFI